MDFRSILQQAMQGGSGTPQAVTYAPGAELGVWNQAPVMDPSGSGNQLYSLYDWNHRAPRDTYQTGYMDGPNGSFQGIDHTIQSDNWLQGLALAASGALGAYYLPTMAMGGAGGAGAGVVGDGAGGMSLAEGAYPSSLGFSAPDAAVGGAGAAGGAGVAGAAPAAAGGGAAATAPAAAAGTAAVNPMFASLASSLGTSPGTLGGLLALGGAALGSQGVKSTQTHTLDPWLMPYAQNQLNYASGLLNQQMSPAYMQPANDIRSGAVGLLAPQQQQNFSRFFPGR